MNKRFAMLLLLVLAATAWAETLAEYPVRWDRGIKEEYGRLVIKSDVVIFRGDDGYLMSFPLLYLDRAKIIDKSWIQLKTHQESGLSFGLNDTYNFGVIGEKPDPAVIERLNRLIVGARELRVASAARLPGEVSRYMVTKSETVGDDVGLLIITGEGIEYLSDTGGRNHRWSYADLTGVQINKSGDLTINTTERAIIKLGLSTRNYQFTSVAGPFKSDDIAFIMEKIATVSSR